MGSGVEMKNRKSRKSKALQPDHLKFEDGCLACAVTIDTNQPLRAYIMIETAGDDMWIEKHEIQKFKRWIAKWEKWAATLPLLLLLTACGGEEKEPEYCVENAFYRVCYPIGGGSGE